MRRIALTVCSFAVAFGMAGAASARIGVTSVTNGEPLGKPPTANERVLHVGLDVQANERVTTRENDRTHLVFLDGSSLTIGPNAELTLDKFVYDPDRKIGEIALTTGKGAFRFVGGAISKTNEVKITTPTAVLGIRGGIVEWSHDATGNLTTNFLYGQSLTVTQGSTTQVANRAGSRIMVPLGGRPMRPHMIPPGGMMGDRTFERPPQHQAMAQQQQPGYQPPSNQNFQPQQQPGQQQGQFQQQPGTQPANQPATQPGQQPPPQTAGTQPTFGFPAAGPNQQFAAIDRAFNASDFGKLNSGLGGDPNMGPGRGQPPPIGGLKGKGPDKVMDRGPPVNAVIRPVNLGDRGKVNQFTKNNLAKPPPPKKP